MCRVASEHSSARTSTPMHLLTFVVSATCARTLPIPAPTSRNTSRSSSGSIAASMSATPDGSSSPALFSLLPDVWRMSFAVISEKRETRTLI
ncbi:hypothetical protein PR001_g30505, partial [Phytophthora rubi]